MEDKICEILKKGDMSISDIRDNLGDVGRAQLVGLLGDMVEKGVIIKKVADDRSYYGLKDNKVLDKKVIDEEEDLGDIFSNDKYSFKIPKSFKVTKEDDRDFVAYLPNGKGDYDNGGADVIIFASGYIPVPSDKIKKMIPEVRSTLYEVTFWGVGNMLNISDDEPEYELVDIGYDVGMITSRFGTQYNFNFICPIGNEYKQMRIVIESSVGAFSKLRDMAIDYMRGFTPKDDFEIPDLNDKKYMNKLNKFLICEWIDNIKNIDLNIKVLLGLVANCEKNRYQYLKSDRSDLLKRLKKRVKWVSSVFDKYLLQAYEFIKLHKGEDLTSIYYNLNLFISNCGEVTIDVEGEKISYVSSKVQDIYYDIFDEEILKMIENYDPVEEDDFDFINHSREVFKDICREWDKFKDSYLDEIEGKVFNSEFALKLEVNSIKKKASSFGERFEDLLFDIDEASSNYDEKDIKKLVGDIFKAFDNIHLDFSSEEFDLDNFDYPISKDALKIKNHWLGDNELDIDMDEYEKEVLEIKKLKEESINKKTEKLNSEYGDIIKKTDDKIKKLKKDNLDILDQIDGLSKIKFRKKDKLNKEIEANNEEIKVLEARLNSVKSKMNKRKDSIKDNYIIPISPVDVYEKMEDMVETDTSLDIYLKNKEIMDDVVKELTYIAKEVTVSELLELSDKLSSFSNSKISSLLSTLEKEGRVNKTVISKKSYYSVNEGYENKLDINPNYSFGSDVWKVYKEVKKRVSSVDNLASSTNLSKTRVMQCLYYLTDENKVYIKDDKVYLR